MKANEVPKSKFVYPDKLYARCNDNKMLDISYAPQTLEAIEYTRTDAIQKEPTSVWHDAIEVPEIHRKFLARYADGKINGSWERHDDGVFPWKGVVREHKITHWCYVEDLNKTIRL